MISGDTRVCEEVADLATGDDMLVHEAMRLEAIRPMFAAAPHLEHVAEYHAENVELGTMAHACGVPILVLTHLIPPPTPGVTTKQDYIDDVRRGGYTGEIVVADDLDVVNLPAQPT